MRIKKRMSDSPSADMSKKASKSSSLASEDRVMAVAADVREVLLQFFAEDDDVVVEGVRYATQFPTLVLLSPDESLKMLRVIAPKVDGEVLVNVAVALSQIQLKHNSRSTGSISGLSYSISHSYQAKGRHAKASLVDLTLPGLLDSIKAEVLWGGNAMWNSCVQLKSMEEAMQALQQFVSAGQCFFDYEVVARKRSVAGTLKPAVVVKLKDFASVEHSTVGALLSLHSSGSTSCFDNDFAVGQLITYGQEYLNRIPERLSVVLGITDLKQICWFRLTRFGASSSCSDADLYFGGFKVGRSCTTSSVKESIGGILTAEPASLGLQMEWRAHLPEGWTITRYLGSGKTSNVYEVDRGGGNGCVALKVFKNGYAEHGDDARYLNELQSVDGVPRVIECNIEGSMLVMEPVGGVFGASAIGQDLPLADLVDVLQNAHGLNIVNRDVRQENIMVAKSLETGKLRLFIHDWGFAEKSDCKSGRFRGSILTAFNDVLQQYVQGARYLVYKPADDLISLVRCIFLVLNPRAAAEVNSLGTDAKAVLNFWKMLQSGPLWKAALEAATKADYDGLKAAFKAIEDATQVLVLKACLLPIHGFDPPQEFNVYESPEELDGFDPPQEFVGLDEDQQLKEYEGFEAALDKYYFDSCLEYMEEQEIERAFDDLDDVDKYYFHRCLEYMEGQEIERASDDSDDSVWFYDPRNAYYDFIIRECLLDVEIEDACNNVVYDIEEPRFGFFERLCMLLAV